MNYQLDKKLKTVGDIEFYQAQDEEQKNYTAASLYGGRTPGSGLAARDFIQEVEDLIVNRVQIDHPDCLFYRDIVKLAGDYYLIRQQRELIPLADYLANNKLKIEKIVDWMQKLIEIYQQAVEEKLDWPGLMPESLWVDQTGELVVIDPIVTKRILQYRPQIRWSVEEMILQPPEIIKNESWMQESYVYTLGILMYYLLTKEFPFSADDKHDLYAEIKQVLPLEPKLINKEVGPQLNQLVMDCLQKDKEDRIADLATLNSRLTKLAEQEQITANAEEKEKLAAKKEKLTTWFNLKRKGILLKYKYWRHGVIGLIILVGMVVLFSVGGYTPQVTKDTPPEKVVDYFYQSINQKHVNLMEEVVKTDQVDYLEKMIIEGHVIESSRKMYGSDSSNGKGTKFVYKLDNLRLTQVSKSPIKFRANYKFIFNDPKKGQLVAKMEDYLILKQVKEKWKIVNIQGTITNRKFLKQAEEK